jgi:peptide-methionine (S)-S-oxide reductase
MKNITIFLLCTSLFACQSQSKKKNEQENKKVIMNIDKNHEIATFAGGCFWCTEAIFLEMKGVQSVMPGYIGGAKENPTYEEVCTGTTGHAEAIQILFDPQQVAFETLLEIFFATHDPTTLNAQGADVGTQYRSEVFYHNKNQKEITENYILQLSDAKTYNSPIVTFVSEASKFYPAEDYHKNYYNLNKSQSYCNFVITPKVEKAKKLFANKIKN